MLEARAYLSVGDKGGFFEAGYLDGYGCQVTFDRHMSLEKGRKTELEEGKLGPILPFFDTKSLRG